jgi:streptogramin lyase
VKLGIKVTAILSAALAFALSSQSIAASHVSIAAAVGTVTEYPVQTVNPGVAGIAAGPDGNMWFTEFYADQIGKITPSGSVTEYAATTLNSEPIEITAGPDGNLWFTEYGVGKIGKITPSGTVTEYPVPTTNSQPHGITAGPDGNVWFTEDKAAAIGRITTAGSVTEFPLAFNTAPIDITTGADGNLWFAESHFGNIGRITPGGVVTMFPLPTTNSSPAGIAAGPDGNLWFTEFNVGKVGRITTSGTAKEFPISNPLSQPISIAAGTDGKLWFAEFQMTAANKAFGSITTSGAVTEYPTPNPNGGPRGIAAGPDGNIWFTELYIDKIARAQDANSGTKYVLDLASGFAPVATTVPQGKASKWTFLGPTSATATDSSGMGLFDSGSKSFVTFFTFAFIGAGTYPYADTLHPTHTGTIKVPVKVSPTTGTTSTTFTITWASVTASAGYVFDVQIKRPGSTVFVNWMTSQTVPSASFVADAGVGAYSFRSRLRNTANAKASGYSAAASIAVS